MFKKGDTGKTRGGYDYQVLSTRRGMLQVVANGMEYSCWPDGKFSGSGGTDLDLMLSDSHDTRQLVSTMDAIAGRLRAVAEAGSEAHRRAYEKLTSAMEELA